MLNIHCVKDATSGDRLEAVLHRRPTVKQKCVVVML